MTSQTRSISTLKNEEPPNATVRKVSLSGKSAKPVETSIRLDIELLSITIDRVKVARNAPKHGVSVADALNAERTAFVSIREGEKEGA